MACIVGFVIIVHEIIIEEYQYFKRGSHVINNHNNVVRSLL